MRFLIPSLLVFSTASVHAWNIIYYSKSGCQGDVVAHDNIVDSSIDTCHLPAEKIASTSASLPTVQSARISGLYTHEGGVLKRGELTSHILRVYHNTDCSNNCTHRNVIAQMRWDDCVSWPDEAWGFKGREREPNHVPVNEISFNIVEVGDTGDTGYSGGGNHGSALSDGPCALSHGDRMVIRGREYRMQQVAASWFHQIPAAEWDDKLHHKSTTHRFAQHGDIDRFGRKKMWQSNTAWLTRVAIEQWDESLHVAQTPTGQAGDQMMYAIEQICSAMDDNDAVLQDIELLAKVPSLDVARLCKEYQLSRPQSTTSDGKLAVQGRMVKDAPVEMIWDE